MEDENGEPRRFKRYPYGPGYIRLVMCGLSIVVGAVYALRNIGGVENGEHHAVVAFIMGGALVVLGIIGVPVVVWMAKRNL